MTGQETLHQFLLRARDQFGERGFGSWGFVARHGLPFEPAEYDAEKYGPAGKLGECYMNATHLAWRSDLIYVEGIATSCGVPLEHAWCVDREGRVVDPTWTDVEEREYVGVPVEQEYLFSLLEERKVYGVMSLMMRDAWAEEDEEEEAA